MRKETNIEIRKKSKLILTSVLGQGYVLSKVIKPTLIVVGLAIIFDSLVLLLVTFFHVLSLT
jgi:hypothetical protein